MLARCRLSVLAASIMGAIRECVAQKYQALKYFSAHFWYEYIQNLRNDSLIAHARLVLSSALLTAANSSRRQSGM